MDVLLTIHDTLLTARGRRFFFVSVLRDELRSQPFWLKPTSVFPDLTWHGTEMMGHTRALVTIRTVGGSMVYINNQLASEFLQLLSGDGQTIDNDIQRRADTVTTSMQLQKNHR